MPLQHSNPGSQATSSMAIRLPKEPGENSIEFGNEIGRFLLEFDIALIIESVHRRDYSREAGRDQD